MCRPVTGVFGQVRRRSRWRWRLGLPRCVQVIEQQGHACSVTPGVMLLPLGMSSSLLHATTPVSSSMEAKAMTGQRVRAAFIQAGERAR